MVEPDHFYEALTAWGTVAAAVATFAASAIALWLGWRSNHIKARGYLGRRTLIHAGIQEELLQYQVTNLSERPIYVTVFGVRVQRTIWSRIFKRKLPVLVSIWDHYTNGRLSDPVQPGRSLSHATVEIDQTIRECAALLAKSNLSIASLRRRLVAVAWTPWRDVVLKIEYPILSELLAAVEETRHQTSRQNGEP